jgi:vacuolar protein-sorting-associated protein 4
MADGGAHMRERGLGDIHTAIDLDKAGQFDEAIKKYTKGIEFLITSNKYETNERTKEMVKARAAQYLTRLEQLKKMQDEGGGTADSPKPAPPGGVVQAKKGGGQGASQDVKDKSAMREALMDAVQMEVPNISFDDVAGLEGAKAALKEAVIKPALYPQLFRGERKPWKGILLYGPPGTGKSYLAKALANESKIEGREDTTFFSVSSSDLVSKYVGESERLVRNLFELAREHKPSIIFVDEIDSLCTARSDQESDSARRIKVRCRCRCRCRRCCSTRELSP